MLWCTIAAFLVIMVASFIRRTDRYEDFCVGFALVVVPLALVVLDPTTFHLSPFTWDARLRAVDVYVGLDGFALGRLCYGHPWLTSMVIISYGALPFAFALSWILERSWLTLRAAVIGGVLAFPCYLLIPACGPRWAFPGYPWHPQVLSGLVFVPMHPRNCFPSMHYAWALLLTMNMRSKTWRAVFYVFSVLTILATVGIGEHYFIDLIAAVPFAFAVQNLAERSAAWQARSKEPCVGSRAALPQIAKLDAEARGTHASD